MPRAIEYFPDLRYSGNRICRIVDHGLEPLESDTSTDALMNYLNPTPLAVEDTEVIQAAKLVHWAQNDAEHRRVQIEVGIQHIKENLARYATQYQLDGASDTVCLLVVDIRHQGRAKSSAIIAALASADPVEALLQLGEPKYHERVLGLRREIEKLTGDGTLGKHMYSLATRDFVTKQQHDARSMLRFVSKRVGDEWSRLNCVIGRSSSKPGVCATETVEKGPHNADHWYFLFWIKMLQNNPRHLSPALQALVLFAAGLASGGAIAGPSDASEFAIRWAVADGGPSTAAEVIAQLKPNKKVKKPDIYTVTYFSVTAPVDAPKGFTAVLRERSKGVPESTWKYRGEEGFPAPALAQWACPLKDAKKAKDEVDYSFAAEGEPTKAYSRSCTAKGTVSQVAPAALGAHPKGCTVKMTRLESDGFKVEEWVLARGEVVLEVSMEGLDTEDDRKKFGTDVRSRLVPLGVKPLKRSKSELGSDC